MGFFKKIGKAIKKASKQVSFKNLIKVASSAGVPLIGNIQDAHYAKKEEQRLAQEMANQPISYVESVANYPTNPIARTNPNFGDFAMSAGAGALTGIAQTMAGTTTAGNVGASLADNVLTTWLKANWWKVGLALTVVGAIIYFSVKKGNKSRTYRRR